MRTNSPIVAYVVLALLLLVTPTIASADDPNNRVVAAGSLEKENTLYLLEYSWGDRCYGIRSASESSSNKRNDLKDVALECYFNPNADTDTTLYASPEVTSLGMMEDGEVYFYINREHGDRCFVTREEDSEDTALALECYFGNEM